MIQVNGKRIVLMPVRYDVDLSYDQSSQCQKEIQYELDKEESYDDFMDRLYKLEGAREKWYPWFVEEQDWGLGLNINVRLREHIIEPLADRYHIVTEGFIWYEMPWGSIWVWYIEPQEYEYSISVRVFRNEKQFWSFLGKE